MPALLQNAVRTLRRTTKSVAGVTVSYRTPGGTVYPNIRATMDNSVGEAETDEGLQLVETLKDWKIARADLPVKPERLGTIIWPVDASTTEHYLILSNAGQREVEPLGNFGDTWLVHTKQIPRDSASVPMGNLNGVAYADPNDHMYGGPNE